MYRYKIFLLILAGSFLIPFLVSAQTDPILYTRHLHGGIPVQADVQADVDLYHRQVDANIYKQLESRRQDLQRIIPFDDLIVDYLERGFDVECDTISLFTLFNEDQTIFTPDERLSMLDEIYVFARKYKSKQLKLFADHMTARLIDHETEYDKKMECFERVVREAKKIGDNRWVAYTIRQIWFRSFYGERYAQSFANLHRLIEALDNVDDGYPHKGMEYIWPGIAYYRFWDFDKALYYFSKGLSYWKPEDGYIGGNYLRAWSYLAAYHHERGNLDSAAYYNRTILTSSDGRMQFQDNLDFAVCNLGRIEMQRGNYDGAIALLEAGLENIEKDERSFEFMCGVYISLGECYLAKGDLKTAASFIDKSRKSIPQHRERNKYNRLRALYALESNYYSRTGDSDGAAMYLDSALIAGSRFEKLTGEHLVLLGEQQLQEAEVEIKNQQIARLRSVILLTLASAGALFCALLVIIRLYRRRNAAYKKLAQKAQEWASISFSSESETVSQKTDNTVHGHGNEVPGEEDLRIMALADREMSENYAYREVGITLDSLAANLDIRRNLLSGAINRVTGGNFNQYINSYRIREAVRIISETGRAELYIDELSGRVGFTNRSTFSRTFKQFTGLSPLEFQKQKGNGLKLGEF